MILSNQRRAVRTVVCRVGKSESGSTRPDPFYKNKFRPVPTHSIIVDPTQTHLTNGATPGWSAGRGPDLPFPPTSRVNLHHPQLLRQFFLGGPFWGSVTRGVGTIIYESLQCTNHHTEPAFWCKIVVDFQYVPRTLTRICLLLLEPVPVFWLRHLE